MGKLVGTRAIFLIISIIFSRALGEIYFEIDNGTKTAAEKCAEDFARPFIWPMIETIAAYESPSDPRSTSVNNYSASYLVNTYLILQFNCSYHRPIHWVFQLDPETTSMNIEKDFSERIALLPDRADEPRYKYTANFRLLYFSKDLQVDRLFSCEPIDWNDRCERNFIQFLDGNIKNYPTSNPAIHTLNSFEKNNSIDDGECAVKLLVKISEGRIIKYKWVDVGDSGIEIDDSVIRTNESAYLENVFRFSNITQGIQCLQLLKENEPCENCQNVGRKSKLPTNGVIFYARFNNQLSVYKGFFSVPTWNNTQRKFYFDWQLSTAVVEEDMIQLKVPELVFANIPFNVTCRVSTFVFSYGTIISDKLSPDLEKARPREYYNPLGYREVILTMTIDISKKTKVVTCFAPLKKSPEWTVKSQEVFVDEAITPTIDGLNNTSEFYKPSTKETGIIARCNASGNPTPTIQWILPDKLPKSHKDKLEISQIGTFSQIKFPVWEAEYLGTYLCEAKNFLGSSVKSITYHVKDVDTASRSAYIVSLSLGVSSLILALVISILAWRIRKQRLEFETQTRKAIDEFRNGVDTSENIKEDDILDPNFSVMQLPYNESFEVDMKGWNIEEKILGSGQFGVVRMGDVSLKGERVKVAVKSLKSAVEIDEFKGFLFELKIMAYLGQNKNIVSLVAACTEGINDRNIYIGVEYCDNGCLLDYMRKFRSSFQNMVSADGKIVAEMSFMENAGQYANICAISTFELYRWGFHVACGMDYLKSKKVLHGDLAARNVLLNARKIAKVGDFGLSRVLMNSDNYTKKSQTPLPWKWMAIESLRSKTFSVNSDVWAYGVLLYEIFTVGQSPYPGVGWSPDFVDQLEEGLRMEKPVFCTTSVYKVMSSCWDIEPSLRPSYAKIKRKLSKGLNRLSILLKSNQPSSDSPQTQNSSNPSTAIDIDLPSLDAGNLGHYRNLQRRTMNYYKN